MILLYGRSRLHSQLSNPPQGSSLIEQDMKLSNRRDQTLGVSLEVS